MNQQADSGDIDMRERILRAATRAFAARGYDGASLKAIADDVGIRKPSLLYHFASKDALRLAVLEAVLTRWKEVLPRLLAASTSGPGRLEAVTGEVILFFRADPDRARLLMREVLDRPAEMRRLLEDHVAPWIGAITEHLRADRDAGLVHRDLDPEAFVAHVVQIIIGALAMIDVLGVLVPGPDRDARLARELARFIRAGVFSSPTYP